jgi:Domain of unknown function (DUF4396)
MDDQMNSMPSPDPHHSRHAHHQQGVQAADTVGNLNRIALSATLHCLTGCAIGEVLGMVAGAALGWSNAMTIVASIVLAFAFGYGLTVLPVYRAGIALGSALALGFASDTASITVMEIVDNAIMVLIPGAMDAGLTDVLFWGSLIVSLAVAGAAAYPVNRWLIARGKGHALVHATHH